MDPLESDTLMRLLVNMATHQLALTQDMRTVLQDLRDCNKAQQAINHRLEKRLQSLLPPSPNGP